MGILSSDLSSELFSLINEGSIFDEQKNYDKAIECYSKAWSLMPEPKNEWDLSVVVTSSLFHSYFNKGDFDKAEKWANLVSSCKPTDEESVLIYLGMVYYELNQYKKSLDYFDDIYNKVGKRAFKDFPKKYLDFYLKQKKNLNKDF